MTLESDLATNPKKDLVTRTKEMFAASDVTNGRENRLARAVLFLCATSAFMAIIPLIAAMFLLPGDYVTILVYCSVVIVALAMIPMSAVITGKPEVSAWLLCGFLSLALAILGLISGGTSSVIMPMLMIPVVWAWFLVGQKGGLFFLLAGLATVILNVMYADTVAPNLPSIRSGVYGILQSIIMTITLLACSLAGYLANRNESIIHSELVDARDTARRTNREKSEMVAGIAHEIRTPLTGLVGMLDLLGTEKLNARQTEMTETSRTSARTILNLINDLLDLSKIEIGELRLIPEPVDVVELFQETTREFKQSAEGKGLRFEIIAPNESVWLLIDPLRFRQIVSNYLSNAVKFTQSGTIRSILSYQARDNGEVLLKLSVADTGPGIPADSLRRVFGRFIQVERDQKANYGGTGIGLAIVSDLARLQGGKVWVESRERHGATFFFESVFKRTSAQETTVTPPPGTEASASITVLVADDNKANRKLLSHVLKELGFAIHLANDGREALQAVQAGHIDVVLMDMNMPVMNGPTSLAEIRKLAPPMSRTPVIGISADNRPEDIDLWQAAGVTALLEKPIDFAKLAATIQLAYTGAEVAVSPLVASASRKVG